MARRSDPSNAQPPSLDRFYVWDEFEDAFDYVQLAQNWDRLDAMLGRPTGDSEPWPPTQGSSGGLWALIEGLLANRAAIGDVKDWWFPCDGTETLSEIEGRVEDASPGWVIADGRIVDGADHEFPGPMAGSDICVPDLRNAFILGASIMDSNGAVLPPGTVGTPYALAAQARVDSPAGAPGISLTDPSSPTADADGVTRGSGTGTVTGANASAALDIEVDIPDHFHYHDHAHGVGIGGNPAAPLGIAGWQTAASGATTTLPTASGGSVRNTTAHTHTVPPTRTTGPVGSGGSGAPGALVSGIAGTSDSHSLHMASSLQVVASGGSDRPGTADPRYWPTSRPGKTAPGNAGGNTLGTGSTTQVTLDKRPRSMAMLRLIKVRHATAS